jgi:peptidoglycan/xylan/chitin deacetylase (PgdA/CDA1 family)/Tfp pilus assembly protein PilF
MTYRTIFIVVIAAIFCAPPASAASPRDTAAAWALHVLEGSRYFEATQAAGQLMAVAPSDAGAYQVRATIALHIGDIGQATRDFRAARAREAHPDPLTAYGLALCAMYRKDYPEATTDLATAGQGVDDDHKSQVTLARVVLLAAKGDPNGAIQTANTLDNPAAKELAALASYHISEKNGLPMLESFLADSARNGVPQVVEPVGLRILGAVGSGTPLEPSVVELPLQAMLSTRLEAGVSGQAADRRHALAGVVKLSPPTALELGGGQAMVSLSADGKLIGMVNSAPYSFNWDTTTVTNGPHTLIWSADNPNGSPLGQATRTVYVVNKEAVTAQSDPLPDTLQARIWKLLIIHPAYKVAEYLMAISEARAGDKNEANDHFLVAAALDPTYKDGGARVKSLFAGVAPANFPLPKGVKLPSTGSIAGENHTEGLWVGNPKKYEIALTFDDGPYATDTPPLLDALRAAHAPATFFIVGMRAVETADVVRRMASEGDDVEDHSYSHPNLDEALPNHIREEVLRGAVVVRSLAGHWPSFFRPPGGDADPRVLAAARECGLSGAFWTVDALSAEETGSPAAVTKWVVSHARPGAIILMHNGTASSTAAIPSMVRELRARGYRLVTLRQLAKDAL